MEFLLFQTHVRNSFLFNLLQKFKTTIMKSNFKIKCPFCEQIINLFDYENVKDEFFDDNDTSEFDCPNCNSELEITTHCVYSFSAELSNEDDCLYFKNEVCENKSHCKFKIDELDSNDYKCSRF